MIHNPANLNDAQVEINKGFRLLTENELGVYYPPIAGNIDVWWSSYWKPATEETLCLSYHTYRTNIPAELYKNRFTPQEIALFPYYETDGAD